MNTKDKMVYVPGGSFLMGNPDTIVGWDEERPVHKVTLAGFYMGKYQVTQAQYQEVTGKNPSHFKGDNLPVEQVSWYDAIEFCNALSEREGLSPYNGINKNQADPNNQNEKDPYKWTVTRNSEANGYRLPTEAQWEYAAKGGNGSPGGYTYSGSNNAGDVAWYEDNSGGKTHDVGKKAANGLGLYDMSGNVWEWCWDWYGAYSGEAQTDPAGAVSPRYAERVDRGGAYDYPAQGARSAYRIRNVPYCGYNLLGFRLVCS
jgi:formylglycine-generating enzyme required for sulfatase activity